MENRIKNCPFCGEKTKIHRGYIKGTITFLCTNEKCGADAMFSRSENDVIGSVEKWNKRKGN